MERLISETHRSSPGSSPDLDTSEDAHILLSNEAELHVESARHLAIPEELFRLNQLDVLYHGDAQTLWTYMRPQGRPSFTPPMLADFANWQRLIELGFVEGAAVELLHQGLFGGDPIAVRVADTTIALRRREAMAILVTAAASP